MKLLFALALIAYIACKRTIFKKSFILVAKLPSLQFIFTHDKLYSCDNNQLLGGQAPQSSSPPECTFQRVDCLQFAPSGCF